MESVAVLSDIHVGLGGRPRSSSGGRGTTCPAACAAVCAQSSYPDIAEWTDYFLHSRANDVDALAVMAPRDGR